MAKINVNNTEITIITYDEKDYISLTDMVRDIEYGLSLIEKKCLEISQREFVRGRLGSMGRWSESFYVLKLKSLNPKIVILKQTNYE